MSGSSTLTLRTYPSALICINCRKCNRSAQYPRSVLQKRFSLDTPMVDILSALTSCQHWDDDFRSVSDALSGSEPPVTNPQTQTNSHSVTKGAWSLREWPLPLVRVKYDNCD